MAGIKLKIFLDLEFMKIEMGLFCGFMLKFMFRL